LAQHTKPGQIYQNGSKKRPNGHKIYQHLPLQDTPKFTHIGIFGLKIYHLATLRHTIHPFKTLFARPFTVGYVTDIIY
jgi:hypothetical protein